MDLIAVANDVPMLINVADQACHSLLAVNGLMLNNIVAVNVND